MHYSLRYLQPEGYINTQALLLNITTPTRAHLAFLSCKNHATDSRLNFPTTLKEKAIFLKGGRNRKQNSDPLSKYQEVDLSFRSL